MNGGDVMGYRDKTIIDRSGAYDFCIMEVRLRKKGAAPGTKEDVRLLMVDSHIETLQFVQENMQQFVGNIVRLRRLETQPQAINESAKMFRKNLEPLLSTLAAANGEGMMDKLSASLKKALLLMVMERYHDREKACRILGISREKLDKELILCGVAP
jgi:DNA-binding protein Fis